MKTKLCPLILLIVFHSITSAQDIDIHWDRQLANNREPDIVLLGTNTASKSFYLLSSHDNKYFLQQFNKENKKVLDNEVRFSSIDAIGNGSFSIEKVLMLKDRFLVLVLCGDEKRSMAKFILQEMSFKGDLPSTAKVIAECNSSLRASYYVTASPDMTKIAFCLAVPKQKNNNENKLIVKVFNEDLSETSARYMTITAEANEKLEMVHIEDILIANTGNIYLLGNKYLKGRDMTCSLWSLTGEADNIKPLSVNLVNKIPKKYAIKWNALNEPVLVGLFAVEGEKHGQFGGYFYGRIDDSAQTIDLKTGFLPQDNQLRPHHADELFPEWFIMNMNDGGLAIIIEYEYRVGNNYHFGNLFVMNVDGNGSLGYTDVVYKNQIKIYANFRRHSPVMYYSYLPLVNEAENKLTILFNDNMRNNNTTNEKPKAYLSDIENSVLTKIVIDHTGNLSKSTVSTPDNNATALCGGLRVRYNDSEWAVFGFNHDTVWLGRMTVK